MDTLLRPQRCATCGALSRRVFTLGSRYVCDKDACLRVAVRDVFPALPEAEIVRLIAVLQQEFE